MPSMSPRLSMARLPLGTLVFTILRHLANGAAVATTSSVSFKPTVGATWNIELSKIPKIGQADGFHIWDFDMAEAPKSTIDAFHAKGHPVICYFSAGTVESYRKDADEFPKVAIGKVDQGWPQEHWVDVRNSKVRDIMKQRMDKAHSKGCDGIDPDNIDVCLRGPKILPKEIHTGRLYADAQAGLRQRHRLQLDKR